MNRQIRLLPALLAVVAVLLVSVAGTATAAKLITGKQVKNGTIASIDVKNNNLTGTDVKNSSLTGADVKDGTVSGADVTNSSLTGVDVKDGTVTGADVKPGSIGPDRLSPAALNEVRSDSNGDQFVATCADTALHTCGSLAITGLTPGTWLVTGTVTVDNSAAAPTAISDRCGLTRDGSLLAESRVPLAANGAAGEAESISLTQVVVATDSIKPVALRCTEMGGENLQALSPSITAVRVR